MTLLEQQLDYDKAYRKHRLSAALWVVAHPETMTELIEHIYHPLQKDQSHKAAWVLELVAVEDLSLLFTHLDLFIDGLSFPTKEATVRPLANICERLCLAHYKKKQKALKKLFTITHKEKMTEACFDWIMEDKKVACSARAMTVLYHIGTEIEWIHPELYTLLQQKAPQGTAGYKNRAQKILKLLETT